MVDDPPVIRTGPDEEIKMSNAYTVARVLGASAPTSNQHHNNKYGVIRTRDGSSTGAPVFVAAGDKAEERAGIVAELFSRARSADDERFLQALLHGDAAAEAALRTMVGAKPRSTSRGGRFAASATAR